MARVRGIALRFRRGAAKVQRELRKALPFTGKQELGFADRALPLAAIYILGDRRDDPAPLVEELTPQRAFLALVANTFATNTLDSEMRAKEFEILARLAPSVPIRVLCAHQDPSRLQDLCDLLAAEAQKMDSRKSRACSVEIQLNYWFTQHIYIEHTQIEKSLILSFPVSRSCATILVSNGVSVPHDSAPSPEPVGNGLCAT